MHVSLLQKYMHQCWKDKCPLTILSNAQHLSQRPEVSWALAAFPCLSSLILGGISPANSCYSASCWLLWQRHGFLGPQQTEKEMAEQFPGSRNGLPQTEVEWASRCRHFGFSGRQERGERQRNLKRRQIPELQESAWVLTWSTGPWSLKQSVLSGRGKCMKYMPPPLSAPPFTFCLLFIWIKVCVCVHCVYVWYMCSHVYEYTHVCEGIFLNHLFFFLTRLHWTWRSPAQGILWHTLFSQSAIQSCATRPFFLYHAGDPNLDLHPCMASTVQTEASPQSTHMCSWKMESHFCSRLAF